MSIEMDVRISIDFTQNLLHSDQFHLFVRQGEKSIVLTVDRQQAEELLHDIQIALDIKPF